MADDFSELMQLAVDLDEVGPAVSPFARKAIQVTSMNIKKQAQASAGKRRQIGHAASAIHYETKESSSGVDAEIGYDKGGAGDLGNIVEFGSSQFTPSHDLGNALLNNEEDFVRGMARAAHDALKRGGL